MSLGSEKLLIRPVGPRVGLDRSSRTRAGGSPEFGQAARRIARAANSSRALVTSRACHMRFRLNPVNSSRIPASTSVRIALAALSVEIPQLGGCCLRADGEHAQAVFERK